MAVYCEENGATCCSTSESIPIITHVGRCKGDFIQQVSYEYVGAGKGDHASVAVEKKSTFCCCCCCWILGVLVVVCISCVLVWLCCFHWQKLHVASHPRTLPFDCSAGLRHFELGWSEAKKDWCCRNAGKGCSAGGSRLRPRW